MKLPLIAATSFLSCLAVSEHDGHFLSYKDQDKKRHVRSMIADDAEGDIEFYSHAPTPTEEGLAALTRTMGIRRLFKAKQEAAGVEQEANSELVIKVCYHVVGDKISRKQLNREFAALQNGFSTQSCCNSTLDWCAAAAAKCSEPKTNIRFIMAKLKMNQTNKVLGKGIAKKPTSWRACVTRWPEDTNMTQYSLAESIIKNATRLGGLDVLNIWYASQETRNAITVEYPLLDYPNKHLDGIVMNRLFVVGNTASTRFNEGKIVVLATGGWLGLYSTSTFGCEKEGDGILDTPAETGEFGPTCNVTQDTCPSPGLDPIHNYMSFQPDWCRYQWTQGQIDYMHAFYKYYRTGLARSDPIKLQDGVASTNNALPIQNSYLEFYVTVAPAAKVKCRVSANNGDLDIYMNSNRNDYANAECQSKNEKSKESCILQLTGTNDTAYLAVLAFLPTSNFLVRCSTVVP